MKKNYVFTVFTIVAVLFSTNLGFGKSVSESYWSTKNPDNENPTMVMRNHMAGDAERGGESLIFSRNAHVAIACPDPIALCKDTIVYLDAGGTARIDSSFVNNGSSDSCGIASMALDISVFNCSEVGLNIVEMTVTNVSGNSSTCSSTVTVADTIPPELMCPTDITTAADSGVCTSIVDYELPRKVVFTGSFTGGTGNENCGKWQDFRSQLLEELTYSRLTIKGSNDPIGRVLNDPDNIKQIADGLRVGGSTLVIEEGVKWRTGSCGASIELSAGIRSDLCNCEDEYTLRPCIGDANWGGIGTSTCNAPTQIITVEFEVASGGGKVAVDNCDSNPTVIQTAGLPSGSEFPVGITTNTFMATDEYGNESVCSFDITILDTIPPTVAAKDTILYLNGNGIAYLIPSSIDSGSKDNCGIDTMYLSQDTFDCGDVEFLSDPTMVGLKSAAVPELGIMVLLTVKDPSGNSAFDLFNVIVMDTVPPVALCQNIGLSLDEDGTADITLSDIDNGSNDACGIASMELSKSTFDGTNIGVNTVTLSVTDVNGNIGTCTSAVTVKDTIAPVALCHNIGIALDEAGRAKVYPAFIDDGSSDEGGIVSYSLDVTRFSCSDVGKNTVVLSVRDVGGNVSTCNATVTVNDSYLPEVTCKDVEVSLNAEGIAVINSSMIDNGSTAMCGISGIELSQSIFTGANLGENSITMTVTNKSGVTASCEATVIVKDEIAPVASCNSIDVWLSDSSVYELTADDVLMLTNGSSDNATVYDSLQIEVTPIIFDCSNLGDSVAIEVSITDQTGNESSCEAMVYVKDSIGIQLGSLPDIEISLAAGVCETAIDYPEVFAAKPCATFTQLEGLGADGLFPVGTTVETWEAANGTVADTVSFSVIVSSENAVPTIDSIANVTANEEETPVTISLSGISGGKDCIAQEVTVTATNKNTALVTGIEISYTAVDSAWVLNISLATNESGSDTITVVVEDSEGAKASRMFALEVAPVNDAPVLVTQLEDVELNANDTVSILIPTQLGTVFDDIDDTELDYTVKMVEGDLPDWVTIMENDDAVVLSLQTTPADTGCYNVVIEAMDAAGATASDTFEVCVEELLTGISEKNNSGFEFTMYPNPSRGMVSLDVTTSFTGEAELNVMSITGQQIFHETYLSSNRIKFDLSDQVSGAYLVILKVEGKRTVKKLILDRK